MNAPIAREAFAVPEAKLWSRLGLSLIHRTPTALIPRKVRTRVHGHRTTLNLREGIQRTIYFNRYEPEQTAWFRQIVRPGDVVADVGASFGYYTALASSLGARVYAFEPCPLPLASLEQMATDSKNIKLVRAALGGKPGTAELFVPADDAPLYTPSLFPSAPAPTPLRVDVLTLDDFAEERFKLVKIDVEGSEPDVIAGMSRLISQGRVENIVCELNSGWLARNGTTPSELRRQILGLGFRVVDETPLQFGVYGDMTFTLQDVWFRTAPPNPQPRRS